jgi:hypothetical protein
MANKHDVETFSSHGPHESQKTILLFHLVNHF